MVEVGAGREGILLTTEFSEGVKGPITLGLGGGG